MISGAPEEPYEGIFGGDPSDDTAKAARLAEARRQDDEWLADFRQKRRRHRRSLWQTHIAIICGALVLSMLSAAEDAPTWMAFAVVTAVKFPVIWGVVALTVTFAREGPSGL
jgi:hypothetical protein